MLEPNVFKLYLIFSSQHYNGFIDFNGFVADKKRFNNATLGNSCNDLKFLWNFMH
jgi:hypothetical protein